MNPFRLIRSSNPESSASSAADAVGSALHQAGRGDEKAFGRFYDLTAAMVHGIVLRVVRDPGMAEEITQEVFLEIWRLAPRYEPSRGSAKSWAATIAHRRAVDRVRSEQSRRRREEADGRKDTAAFDSVSEIVDDEFERERVVKALASLSETQREAVSLAYYGGHTYREVAALLEVPEGTVKTRIRDGLIRLRDTLGVTNDI
ncbi:MAG: ECF RNA polymerase sigma factor SigK [Acidimicrobiales bacterium]